MTLLLKDPEASLDYAVDWGLEYLTGDTLAQSDWRVTPVETGGISIEVPPWMSKPARRCPQY